MNPKIRAFAGSLRNVSTNKNSPAISVRGMASAGADVESVDLKNFPLSICNGNMESDSGLPDPAVKLQHLMLAGAGFLITSPEYNGSVSGARKNMIDWTSRPGGEQKAGASYSNKAAVLMSASRGMLGGVRRFFDIRKILSTMGVIVLPSQIAVSQSHAAFDEDGEMVDENLRAGVERLGKELTEFLVKIK